MFLWLKNYSNVVEAYYKDVGPVRYVYVVVKRNSELGSSNMYRDAVTSNPAVINVSVAYTPPTGSDWIILK